jgi:uncharacterized protein (DUF433 family)
VCDHDLIASINAGAALLSAAAAYDAGAVPDAEMLPRLLADWNRLDDVGRVILSPRRGPDFDAVDYARFAGRRVLLVDPPESVEAVVEREGTGRWVGLAAWGTQVELPPAETAAVAKFGVDFDERPFPGIWTNPARLSGAPALDGTGIPARRILEYLSSGTSAAELASQCELAEWQVRAVIAYAAWIIGGKASGELAQARERFDTADR